MEICKTNQLVAVNVVWAWYDWVKPGIGKHQITRNLFFDVHKDEENIVIEVTNA